MRPLIMFAALAGLGLMLIISGSPPATAADSWYDTDWGYRYPITLTTYDNIEPGYVFRITLDISSELGGHAESDFDDIIFLENSDNEVLSHWREETVSGDDATLDNGIFWVRRTDNDVTDTQIWVYCGNAGAVNQENGDNTFDLFDDFSVDSLDNVTKWAVTTAGDASAIWDSVNEMAFVYDTDGGYSGDGGMETISSFSRGYVAEFDMRWDDDYAWFGWNETAAPDSSPKGGFYNSGHNVHWSDPDTDTGFDFNNDNDMDVGIVAFENGGYMFDNDRSDATWTDNHSNPQGDASTPLYLTFGAHATLGYRVDNVRIRQFNDPQPTYALGAEETPDQIEIGTPTVTEALIDRDQDNDLTTPTLETVISVQITQITVGENVSTFDDNYVSLFVRDNDGNFVVDNAQPVSSVIDDENNKTFTFAAYNPSDALDNSALGGFDVSVVALDNFGTSDNSGYDTVFTVGDLYDTYIYFDNEPGHTHLVYTDDVDDHGGTAVTLTRGWRVDNNVGSAEATLRDANDVENTYAPSADGTVYFVFETAELDGFGYTYAYFYPNNAPALVSVTVDNALIDNHASDNAITETLITVILEDEDNYDEFDVNEFYIGLRGDDDVLVENIDVSSSVTFENENFAIITLTYDAEDNNLIDAALGNWDIYYEARDPWTTTGGVSLADFVVDDYTVPLVLTPDNSFMGFAVGYNVLAAGTPTRDSGAAASVDHGALVDSAEGTIILGAGAYSENYSIDGSNPGDTVTVTVTVYDGILDGQAENTYAVNDNRFYSYAILAEDNNLNPYNFENNREYILTFYYENGWGTEDNLTANTGYFVTQAAVRNVTLSDNYLYWRSLIPENIADNLVFYLLQDNVNRDLAYQYVYTLEDYTGDYAWPNPAELHIEKLIDNQLVLINSDWWDSDSACPAWLLYNYKHQYTVRNDTSGDSYVAAHYYTTLVLDRTITVRPSTDENTVLLYNVIDWGAWRENQNVRITYEDSLENTDNFQINIYEWGSSTSVYYYTTNSYSVTIDWNGGENGLSYVVEITVEHGNGEIGTFSEARTVGPNLLGFIIAGPDSDDDGFLGGPVPLTAIGSMVIVLIVSLSFGARYDVQGMFGITLIAAVLRLIGWLPIDWALIGFLFFISIVWAIGKGGGRN